MNMIHKIDLSGRIVGRLTVLFAQGRNAAGRQLWKCMCECGRVTFVTGANIRSRHTKSCGCLKDEKTAAGMGRTHGMARSPTYRSWESMFGRCYRKGDPSYQQYGGRGISVCERWHKFTNFLADMGVRPRGLTLDRFPNNDGNYQPSNCRWATKKEQSNNTRQNRTVMHKGKLVTARQLSDETGMPYQLIRSRIFRLGWNVERAIT